METVFREQVVEVVSRNPARNIRKLAPHLLAVAIGKRLQPSIDFGAASALMNEAFVVVGTGRPHAHALAAVGQDLERLDIVIRLAGHDRVHAAGVIADHASQGAAIMRSGVGRKCKVMLLGRGAQIVEHNARFDPGNAARRIDFEDSRHILRKIEHDGSVAALSRERRAASARQQRSVVIAAQGHDSENVFLIARNYNPDRDLAIVGSISGIESAAARIKANLSSKVAAKRSFKRSGVELRGSGGWGDVLWHKAQNIFKDAGAGRKGIWVVGFELQSTMHTIISAAATER